MRAQWTELAAIAIVLVLIAVGCGPSATPTPVPPPPTPLPTPGAATTAFPIGNFVLDGGDPLGGHTCEYKADGTFVYQGHGNTAKGTYTVTGDQVVLRDDYCGGGLVGTYTWTFDGKALTFKALNDKCSARWSLLDNIKWEKKP